MKSSIQAISLAAALTLISSSGIFAQTPPNDDFADRTVLVGTSIMFSGTLEGSTLESAETSPTFPLPVASGGSVWWTWTAPQSTRVVIAILRDFFTDNPTNANLEIYTGPSPDALMLVDHNTFQNPVGRYVSFAATAGTDYQIRVAGGADGAYAGGTFSLKLTASNSPVFVRPPVNCVVSPYESAFFGVIATGTLPLGDLQPSANSYQWKFNGQAMPGQSFSMLLLHGATMNQAGTYSIVISNADGVSESAPVTLTVTDTNPVPRLESLTTSASNQIAFNLTAEPGRWYNIESSQDLMNWLTVLRFSPTNPVTSLSIPRLGPTQFLRACLNVRREVCIGQLKQMHWAGYVDVIEHRSSPYYRYGFTELFAYIPLDTNGIPHSCPEGGTYDAGGLIFPSPRCTLGVWGHVLTVLP